MNWSKKENVRRIVNSLVRYEYIDQNEAQKVDKILKNAVEEKELSLEEMRELSSSLSRNSTDTTRDKVASTLVAFFKKKSRRSA